MPQVQLDDQVFKVAQRRAADAGYASVDEYIADFVVHDSDSNAENFDNHFTPELVAQLDRISNEMKAGKSASQEEVKNHLSDVRETWLKNHAS